MRKARQIRKSPGAGEGIRTLDVLLGKLEGGRLDSGGGNEDGRGSGKGA